MFRRVPGSFPAGGFLVHYNKGMAKYTVREFGEIFRSHLGDSTYDVPSELIINSLNWAFNSLPMVPKLDKIFSKHNTFNLDAKGHYRWNLNSGFRRISNIPMMNFWTSTGGDLCKLEICNEDTVEFFNHNGIPYLKEAGKPCEYTIEQEDDNVWLVFDRPLDVPVVVDYIAYGFPKPVKSMDDEIEISAIAENLIIDVMLTVWFHEAMDFSFSADIAQYLDNKKYLEAIQMLNRRMGIEEPTIVGEI
jgi:hypothetical protein